MLQYLLGKARNVLPDYDAKAQEHLSLAVKLNPSFVDAWNELGKSLYDVLYLYSKKQKFFFPYSQVNATGRLEIHPLPKTVSPVQWTR